MTTIPSDSRDTDYRLRFSHLKKLAQSPAHFRAAVDATESYDSPAMRLGRLVHTLVLGGPEVAVYDGERRGKAWQEFKAAHDGQEIVTISEHEKAAAIARAVTDDPVAARYLLRPDAVTEQRIEWDLDGRPCSSTPDFVSRADSLLVDLKTSQTSEPGRFGRLAIAMHYHAQLAFYRWALEVSQGWRPATCVLVAVETAAPYPVTVHVLTDRALDEGEKLCRAWLERLAVCEASNAWPGYTQAALDLDCEPALALSIDGEEVEL
jgi:hypothetical protein